ncbi:hypothetical protein HCX48_03025 [Rhodocyclus tenuis]|uniref:Cysteine-rich CWC family protein n=3 Tax=Rhodocyclus TaxID=1064 RepID=A0A6L5JVM5_RHOTE|nr:hypothetical protein [Rhodocyclus gracilis]MRD72667.1 hypothetical protein [Rhodocyclus gracilis]NJA88194.1 hypothetical protein [Rhodocyclus gracilis]
MACGREFGCGLAEGAARCWCMDKPPGVAVPTAEEAACYCPQCLDARLAASA